jgi:predicted metal-dependent enzyme (double-stranded beta helix superfamily)
MTFIHAHRPVEALLDRIARTVADTAEEARPSALAEALAPWLGDPALLAGLDCPCGAEHYARHLLHDEPEAGYAVVALVWRPGQMSPVHAHRSWCALGVHQGTLTETYYAVQEGQLPEPAATRLLRPGDTSHGAADPRLIHRLANLSCETAVSLHCYGVAFERMATELNLVLAA